MMMSTIYKRSGCLTSKRTLAFYVTKISTSSSAGSTIAVVAAVFFATIALQIKSMCTATRTKKFASATPALSSDRSAKKRSKIGVYSYPRGILAAMEK
jgi:hypothetical protein